MMGTVWLRLDASQANLRASPTQSSSEALPCRLWLLLTFQLTQGPRRHDGRKCQRSLRAKLFHSLQLLDRSSYLFVSSLLFSVVVYWLSNFSNTAGAFLDMGYVAPPPLDCHQVSCRPHYQYRPHLCNCPGRHRVRKWPLDVHYGLSG